jgi:hypothetical protein
MVDVTIYHNPDILIAKGMACIAKHSLSNFAGNW